MDWPLLLSFLCCMAVASCAYKNQDKSRYADYPRDYYFENEDSRTVDRWEQANQQQAWQAPFWQGDRTHGNAWEDQFDFSGNYGDNKLDDDDYYSSEEYDDFDDDLSFIDKETIAENEDEIYRVRAELEYDEMRIERMAQKLKSMERNMKYMENVINSKYPFGGYYK